MPNSEPSVPEIEGTGRRWYFIDKGPRDTHDLLLFKPNVFKGFPPFSSFLLSLSILAGLEVLLFRNIFPLFSFFSFSDQKKFFSDKDLKKFVIQSRQKTPWIPLNLKKAAKTNNLKILSKNIEIFLVFLILGYFRKTIDVQEIERALFFFWSVTLWSLNGTLASRRDCDYAAALALAPNLLLFLLPAFSFAVLVFLLLLCFLILFFQNICWFRQGSLLISNLEFFYKGWFLRFGFFISRP